MGSRIASLVEFLVRAVNGLLSRYRNVYYRLRGMKLTGYVWMRKIRVPESPVAIEIEAAATLQEGVVLLSVMNNGERGKIFIGANTGVNRSTFIDASLEVRIGRWVAVGPGCYITDHDHGTSLGTPLRLQELRSVPTIIEDDVWLGAQTKVLKGVRIGTGSIIGAGSVVTRDIPSGVIAAGVPARVIGKRV